MDINFKLELEPQSKYIKYVINILDIKKLSDQILYHCYERFKFGFGFGSENRSIKLRVNSYINKIIPL